MKEAREMRKEGRRRWGVRGRGMEMGGGRWVGVGEDGEMGRSGGKRRQARSCGEV